MPRNDDGITSQKGLARPYPERLQLNTTGQANPQSTRQYVVAPKTRVIRDTSIKKRKKRAYPPAVMVSIGVFCALFVFMLVLSFSSWATERYNDLHYGIPRTYQIDAVVGHGDDRLHPSHFVAINLNQHAIVTEYKAGDGSQSTNYIAPIAIPDPKTPITLSFKDVNDDGKPDMIMTIHFPGQEQMVVWINTGKGFRLSTTNDHLSF